MKICYLLACPMCYLLLYCLLEKGNEEFVLTFDVNGLIGHSNYWKKDKTKSEHYDSRQRVRFRAPSLNMGMQYILYSVLLYNWL